MRIIHTNRFPPGKFVGINLLGFIFIKRGSGLNGSDIHHEVIHSRQEAEMLWIPFFVWYGIEWLVKLIKYRNVHKAYFNISFEREAYRNQGKIGYLRSRKPYAWVKYL